MKSILNFACMVIKRTFTGYITPPQTSNISQTRKCLSQNSTCTCITMKKQYTRYSQPQNTQSGQERPRTRVYLVISMVRSSTNTCSHITYRVKVHIPQRKACFFIQSHFSLARFELALLYLRV
jgi:hypothetical protein